MDPRRSGQDVLLCDSCETFLLHSHCELCQINLCTNCIVKHLSDSSKRHNVVPYKQKMSTPNYPKCPKHADKNCELYCEECDAPVCSTCVSEEHRGHILCDVLKKLSSKIQIDLEELETRIYPRYVEMVFDVETEKVELETNYGTLTTAADQQGELWHREITAIVNQRKSDIAEMKTKHMAALDKNTDGITNGISELKQIILNLKAVLESNDISLISTYKSRNNEFRRLPPKLRVTLPSFSPPKIKTDQLREMFGSLSPLSINTEEPDYIMKSQDAVSSPSVKPMKSPKAISSRPVKPLLGEPRIIATIDTGYGYGLRSVCCLNEEEVWTCGSTEIMKLFLFRGNETKMPLSLHGKILTSIQTESGKNPLDIAVTRDGFLVYTDNNNKTVNLVENKQIQTMITLQGWKPFSVCSTSSDDLLVTMDSDDDKQSKVVRYSGSTEKQTIQFDDQGRPLYSSGDDKYISENKNLDICVADYKAKAVVVVNQSGKLRFRYTGHPSNTEEAFYPLGIATDSQSHILTTDWRNHRIDIIDQNGQFLRYIQNCHLRRPWGLCLDIRDNLFVAEGGTAKVNKIQYL